MYICICHAVPESRIRQAVNEGVSDFRELSFRTGGVKLAREVMDDALAESGAPKSAVSLKVVCAT